MIIENNGLKISEDILLKRLTNIYECLRSGATSDERAYYVGGTLCVDHNNSCFMLTVRDEKLPTPIRIILCKIYLSEKTPTHAFYEYAASFLKENNVKFQPVRIATEIKDGYYIMMATDQNEYLYFNREGIFMNQSPSMELSKLLFFDSKEDVENKVSALRPLYPNSHFYFGTISNNNFLELTEVKSNAL